MCSKLRYTSDYDVHDPSLIITSSDCRLCAESARRSRARFHIAEGYYKIEVCTWKILIFNKRNIILQFTFVQRRNFLLYKLRFFPGTMGRAHAHYAEIF